MKNLKISLPYDFYRRARRRAKSAETSLSRVVQDLLVRWATEERAKAELMAGWIAYSENPTFATETSLARPGLIADLKNLPGVVYVK